MPIPNEYEGDAPAGVETGYCFVPNGDGSYDRTNNTFNGTLTPGDDDWVAIPLIAGNSYTFTLSGTDSDGDGTLDEEALMDPVLMIMDSKGTMIMMNDDASEPGSARIDRSSKISFTPEESGPYYVVASAYRGNPNLTHEGDLRDSGCGVAEVQ